MPNFYSYLTHPLLAGPLAGGVLVFLAYLDSKIRTIDRKRETYWKLFIVSSLIFATLVYLIAAEFNQVDEYLEQNYDINPPDMLPKSKGGFQQQSYQPLMRKPSLFGGLAKLRKKFARPKEHFKLVPEQ